LRNNNFALDKRPIIVLNQPASSQSVIAIMKRVDVAIAIVLRGSKLLIAHRKPGGPLGGYWEFPGGKCETGETLEQCLSRELWEELAIRAKPVMSFPPINYNYPHQEVCLHPYVCLHEAGEPQPLTCQSVRWVEPVQLRQYRFPEANTKLIEQIIEAIPSRRRQVKETESENIPASMIG
jgi:mutator protein MutT